MFLLKKILSAFLLPPVSLFVLGLLGVALMGRWPRLGRALTGLALVAALALSLPITSRALIVDLEQAPPITPAQLADVQAIVILGGGNYPAAPEFGGDTVGRASLERIRYGAALHRASGQPLLVTGGAPFGGTPEGKAMQQVLEAEFQVPVRWVESASLDTAGNARLSAPLLKAAGVTRIALVTHAWHIPRARVAFEAEGFAVIPAPTAYTTLDPDRLAAWVPSMRSLERSSRALTEQAGLLVYSLTH